MSVVNIVNVQLLDNPTAFKNPFEFEITFRCNAPLKDDLEWRLIYAGAANSSKNDQLLDSVMVGPTPVGVHKFLFIAYGPEIELLPKEDLLEVNYLILSCLYNDKEFVRVGYYVRNEYIDEELLENPPEQIAVEKLQRYIAVERPKVTKSTIDWSISQNDIQQPQ